MFGKSYLNGIVLLLWTVTQVTLLKIEAFSSNTSPSIAKTSFRIPTSLSVLAEPPRDISVKSSSPTLPYLQAPRVERQNPQKKRNTRHPNIKRGRSHNYNRKEDVWSSGRWENAIKVESQLLGALENLEQATKKQTTTNLFHHDPNHNGDCSTVPISFSFPSIRDCNAALATFGDGEDLLRALRLYFKMRKAAMLTLRYPPNQQGRVPKPTLVTFSTLMSRAVRNGKPLIAVRIWNIMCRQSNFFSAMSSVPHDERIVPDVKAANILMNSYAKLGYVQSAQDLLSQMIEGNGDTVPKMEPNLVTFNTLLDACHKAGDLDVALAVKAQLDMSNLVPDTRTYTSLIATVARKVSVASGAHDPSLAFDLLQEMQSLDIRPNGMTYSALIDVCGRCQRSDLALNGLRLMADQKAHEQKLLDLPPDKRHTLPSEVGAWTAAINACGKAGRLETAIKLFYSMPNYGVYPNTITCGCLTDSLLKNGKVAESLDVLRYMKKYRIAPSEVMYTSLMTSAGRLARFENNRQLESNAEATSSVMDESTSAVQVYTELMKSLMRFPSKDRGQGVDAAVFSKKHDPSDELYRVSLVFQEMKAAGVSPDLACYNALLKSCAHAGDVGRASEVLGWIRASDDLFPNDKSWRDMIRSASKANRLDVALSTWQTAVQDLRELDPWPTYRLSSLSLVALLDALMKGSMDAKVDLHTKTRLCQLVTKLFEAVISGSQYMGMNLVDRQSVFEHPRAMILFLQALVTLEQSNDGVDSGNSKKFRLLAVSIVASECFEDGLPYQLRKHQPFLNAYQVAQRWYDEERWS